MDDDLGDLDDPTDTIRLPWPDREWIDAVLASTDKNST
jgi:hypothetical protein